MLADLLKVPVEEVADWDTSSNFVVSVWHCWLFESLDWMPEEASLLCVHLGGFEDFPIYKELQVSIIRVLGSP